MARQFGAWCPGCSDPVLNLVFWRDFRAFSQKAVVNSCEFLRQFKLKGLSAMRVFLRTRGIPDNMKQHGIPSFCSIFFVAQAVLRIDDRYHSYKNRKILWDSKGLDFKLSGAKSPQRWSKTWRRSWECVQIRTCIGIACPESWHSKSADVHLGWM